MLSMFYVVMEWTTPRCKLFSTLSSSPSIKCVVGIHYGSRTTSMHSFVVYSARCRFVPPDSPSCETLSRTADEKLFKNIITNNQHVLHRFLPLPSHASQNYNLRPRKHNFELPDRVSHLTDCNFIKRMLFFGIY